MDSFGRYGDFGAPLFLDGRAVIDTPVQTQQAGLYQPVGWATRHLPMAGYGVPVPAWKKREPYGGNAVTDFMASRQARAAALLAILAFVYFRVITAGARRVVKRRKR